MANVCDEKECCTVSGQGSDCSVSGANQGKCSVSGCGCSVSGAQPKACTDPFDNAPDVWLKDTVEAIRQVKLEILREKVRKQLGPKLEKAADAVMPALGAFWATILAQSEASQAKENLREEIRKVFSDGKK